MVYDGLLLIALWMIATGVLVAFNHGEAIPPGHLGYQLVLLAIGAVFLCGFWWRAGRTLGMQAWRLCLVRRDDGGPVDLRLALLRYLAALLSWASLGLGFLWSLVDRDRLAWHDRLSGTQLVVIPRRR